MGKFDTYKIDLKGMSSDECDYAFVVDNQFFVDIDEPEIQKGKVHVALHVKKLAGAFEMDFRTEGFVYVTCDRCLDEMEQSIVSTDKLFVKFGAEYAEEGENLIVIPEEKGVINIAWFIYEFVVLAIPMKHVHAPGKCNKAMNSQLNKYMCISPEEKSDEDMMEENDMQGVRDVETQIDPRWNELKKILDNN